MTYTVFHGDSTYVKPGTDPSYGVLIVSGWTALPWAQKFLGESCLYGAIGSLVSVNPGISYLRSNLAANAFIHTVLLVGATKQDAIANHPCKQAFLSLREDPEEELRKVNYRYFDNWDDVKVFLSFGRLRTISTRKPIDIPVQEDTLDIKDGLTNTLPTTIIGDNVTEAWRRLLTELNSRGIYNGGRKEILNTSCTFLPRTWDTLPDIDVEGFVKSITEVNEDSKISYTYGNILQPQIRDLANVDGTQHYYSLWVSGKDTPPCLTFVWFRSDPEGFLHMTGNFRSHAAFSAWRANVWQLHAIHDQVCRQTGLKLGNLTVNSQSFHSYPHEDIEKECKPTLFSDPVGYFVVQVDDNRIKVRLQDRKHHSLIQSWESAPFGSKRLVEKLCQQISKSGWVIQSEHLMYLGQQITLANIKREEYVQDELH